MKIKDALPHKTFIHATPPFCFYLDSECYHAVPFYATEAHAFNNLAQMQFSCMFAGGVNFIKLW
jgi:hypothetical protein